MAGSVTCRLQTNGHTFHGANFHCSGHFAALLLGVCRLGHRGHVAVIAHGWRCILTLAQLRAIRGLCRQEVIPGAYLFCGHLSSSGHQNDPRDQLRGPSSGGPAQSCCSFGSADDTLSLREHRAEEVLDRELTEPALLRSAQASAMRLGDFVRVGERRSGCRAAHVLLPTPLRPQLARGVLLAADQSPPLQPNSLRPARSHRRHPVPSHRIQGTAEPNRRSSPPCRPSPSPSAHVVVHPLAGSPHWQALPRLVTSSGHQSRAPYPRTKGTSRTQRSSTRTRPAAGRQHHTRTPRALFGRRSIDKHNTVTVPASCLHPRYRHSTAVQPMCTQVRRVPAGEEEHSDSRLQADQRAVAAGKDCAGPECSPLRFPGSHTMGTGRSAPA
eukprot:scaffold496_cov380-Prasinococcus_capsulatus_cf.AAC.2